MPVTIIFPRPFNALLEGQKQFQVEGSTVHGAFEALIVRFPKLKTHLFGEGAHVRSFLHIYVNGEDVRNLQGEATPLKENDVIRIVPSIIGGARE